MKGEERQNGLKLQGIGESLMFLWLTVCCVCGFFLTTHKGYDINLFKFLIALVLSFLNLNRM